jgi:hypothetical protein
VEIAGDPEQGLSRLVLLASCSANSWLFAGLIVRLLP